MSKRIKSIHNLKWRNISSFINYSIIFKLNMKNILIPRFMVSSLMEKCLHDL